VSDLVRASELGEELRGRTRDMDREVIARSLELADKNRELREANAKLGDLDAAKAAFFSNVSHEFRRPLTLMLGPLEDSLADTHEPLGTEQRARMNIADGSALRLLELMNTLLDFSRLEAGRLRACYAPLDLAQATAELAGMFQSAVGKTGLRLVIDCPRLSEPAWVDRDMWEKNSKERAWGSRPCNASSRDMAAASGPRRSSDAARRSSSRCRREAWGPRPHVE
jgi:signal transduction histidine kinase